MSPFAPEIIAPHDGRIATSPRRYEQVSAADERYGCPIAQPALLLPSRTGISDMLPMRDSSPPLLACAHYEAREGTVLIDHVGSTATSRGNPLDPQSDRV